LALLLPCALFIGAAFFGRALIAAWVGPGYPESHLLLLVLLGTQIIATPTHVIRCVLFGMGHVRLPAVLVAVEAAANVGLSVLLIQPFGLLGVALGTTIPVIVFEFCLLLPLALPLLGLDAGSLIRRAVGPQLLALAAVWAYSTALSHAVPERAGWLSLVCVALGGGAVLAAGRLGSAGLERLWRSRSAETAQSAG
jgi:O-antigen/teichoic acid export membrane protein